jgi:uncharacterized membrane-anchored protein
MTFRDVPALDARYWIAISCASVFGANTGDFFAHDLGLGHTGGLLPLAALFATLLLIENRSKVRSLAYYWLAIVIIRTAATNIADFGSHDLRLDDIGMIVVLLGLLPAIVINGDTGSGPSRGGPPTNWHFWIAMLAAGTLGTSIGDAVAHRLGLGTSTLITVALLAVLLLLRSRAAWQTIAMYWVAIVAVRTAGTNVGDFIAGRHGFDLGLPLATALSGGALLAALVIGGPRSAASTASA